MDTILDLTAALAAISDQQLSALQLAIDHSPDFARGLLAWLEHAVDCDLTTCIPYERRLPASSQHKTIERDGSRRVLRQHHDELVVAR